jgi:hypothetical protein
MLAAFHTPSITVDSLYIPFFPAGLEHATIRENIVFNSTYHEDRYHSIIEACALERDLEVLDAGDMTGESN